MSNTIVIESTRAVDGKCLYRWDDVERYVPVTVVRDTALDLMTCAAYADLIGELMRIGLDPHHITGLFQSILAKQQRAHFGNARTMFLLPAGSSKRQEGFVLLAHDNVFVQGKTDAVLAPDEARHGP